MLPQQKKQWPGRRGNAPGPGRPEDAWPTVILSHPRPVAVQSAPGFLLESNTEVNTMTTTEKPIAAIWWRVSTKAQADMSPETQIHEAREDVARLGPTW